MQAAVFGAIFQYPGTYGHVRDFTPELRPCMTRRRLAVVATDLLALCMLKDPGAMGADIAVGSASGLACRWAMAGRMRRLCRAGMI